jgi:hypothetical protein
MSVRLDFYDRPVFIIAAPRSGSTLLFETLAQAESLWTIKGESHEVIEGIPSLSIGPWGVSSNRLDASNADPLTSRRIQERFKDKLVNRDSSLYIAGMGKRVRMLEKTPKNSLRVPFLRAVFPDAMFIYLYRDPRENISSIMESWRIGSRITYNHLPDWEGSWSMLLPPGYQELRGKPLVEIAAFQWLSANTYSLEDLSLLPPSSWIAISYEQLVTNHAVLIRRICDFIGIPADPHLQAYINETDLPLSCSTLTPPADNKWHKEAEEISKVMPTVSSFYYRLLKTVLPPYQANDKFKKFESESQSLYGRDKITERHDI